MIQRIDVAELAARGPELLPVYREAFAPAPYYRTAADCSAAVYGLHALARHPPDGLRAAVAVDARDQLVGASWSWRTPRQLRGTNNPFGEGLYTRIATALGGRQSASALLAGRREVVELFVHPRLQSTGQGGGLLTSLLDSEPGWLISWPTSSAYRVYRHWGWRERGRFDRGDGTMLAVLTRDTPSGDQVAGSMLA